MKYSLKIFILPVIIFFPGLLFSQTEAELEQKFHPLDEFPADAIWINSDFSISNSQLKNKVLVINFFAPDCPACSEGLHRIQDFTSKHMQTQLITVIQCDSGKTPTLAEFLPVLWEHGIDHPVAFVKNFSSFRQSNPVTLPLYSFYLEPSKPITTTGDVNEITTILNGIEEQMHIPESEFHLSTTRFESNVRLNEFAEPLLKFPRYLEPHENGVQLFISDGGHHRILLADVDGEVNVGIGSSARGFRDGSFYEASFNFPGGIAYDEKNTRLYIADTENHRVRMADMKTKTVYTITGNGLCPDTTTDKSIDAQKWAFGLPIDLLFHDGSLYVLSAYNNVLYKVIPSSGRATVFAQLPAVPKPDGSVSVPLRITREEQNDIFIVTMSDGNVYAVNAEGTTTKLLGDDPADRAFRSCEKMGDTYIFTEPDSNRVMLRGELKGQAGDITHGFANGKGKKARFWHPSEIAVSDGGNFIADTYNNSIRVISTKKKKISTMVLKPNEQMMRSGDANSVGEHVFLPEINSGQGINTITISLDLGNYKLYADGINEAHPDGVSGVTVKSFDISGGEIILELDPKESTGSIMLEVFMSIEHPDQPGAWLLKSAFVTIPVELSGSGTDNHLITYTPSFFATTN